MDVKPMKTVREADSKLAIEILATKYADHTELEKGGLQKEEWYGIYNGYTAGYTTAQAKHEAEMGKALSLLGASSYNLEMYDKYHRGHDKDQDLENYTLFTAINLFLSTYKKTSVPCEECEDGVMPCMNWDGECSPDPCEIAICENFSPHPCSCQGKGTVERWEKK